MLTRHIMLMCRGLAAAVLLTSVAGCSSDAQQVPAPPVGSADIAEGESFIPFRPVAGVESHPVDVNDLAVGDCLESPVIADDNMTFRGVDCAQAHTVEVFAIVDRSEMYAGDYPGESEMFRLFEEACRGSYVALFGVESRNHQLGLAILAPEGEQAWTATSGSVPCGVFPLHMQPEEGNIMDRYQHEQ